MVLSSYHQGAETLPSSLSFTQQLRFYTDEIQNYSALSFSHRISINYKNYRVIIWLVVVLYHVTCECAQQMLRLRYDGSYSN